LQVIANGDKERNLPIKGYGFMWNNLNPTFFFVCAMQYYFIGDEDAAGICLEIATVLSKSVNKTFSFQDAGLDGILFMPKFFN
jgi:hypothetical protein